MRIAYLLKMFPRLSETFILNELLELERQGVPLSVYSLVYPNDGRFHGRMADFRVAAEYFPREKPENLWRSVRELPDGLAPPFGRWEEAADFLRLHSIPGDLDLLLRAVLIGARARAQGVRHLHAHFATISTRVAALVNILTGIPFSFTAHAKDIFRETVDRRLFAALVERAAFCVTVSDFNRRYILERTPGADPDKVIRIYNGVDLDFFRPGEPARGTNGTPHVVSVGRLVPKKGFQNLLRALRVARDEGMPFRATIVGDGEQRDALLDLREQLDLVEDVEFTGALPQEDVRRKLAEATMVALACEPDADGNMDALPTVLLEALALDVPIVSTTLTGVPEIVGEDAGVLVAPGDDRQLAQGILSLWASIQSRRVPPGAARARGERLFDLRRNVSTLRQRLQQSAASVEAN